MAMAYNEKTFRRLQTLCLGLLLVSTFVLFYVHRYVLDGDQRNVVQTLGRLASAYVEPESNPQSIIRAEDHCRFWDRSYCRLAEVRRKTFTAYFNTPVVMPKSVEQDPQYADYKTAKNRLVKATTKFVAFLNSKPDDAAYKEQAQSFEKEADELVAQIINSLYGLQEIANDSSAKSNVPLLLLSYFCNLTLLVLLSTLRFDWGIRWLHHLE